MENCYIKKHKEYIAFLRANQNDLLDNDNWDSLFSVLQFLKLSDEYILDDYRSKGSTNNILRLYAREVSMNRPDEKEFKKYDAKHGIEAFFKTIFDDIKRKKGIVVEDEEPVGLPEKYQCAKTTSWVEKEHLREWILELEFTVNKLPLPDKMLFLDLPREYIENKMLNERTGADRDYLNGEKDIHEADTSFQSKIYDEYMKLVDSLDDFVAVKCYYESGICSIEEIHKRICEQVNYKI